MYDLFKLDNGLKVVIEKIDYVKSISIGLWVKSGSRNENIQNNGISHFIEHMLFKGTFNRTAKDIAQAIEDVGGQINAFTSKEATCFYIKILSNHIELALDILSDMLFNSKFDKEDIEKEKGVIIEEISSDEDSPSDVLMDLHSKAIWGNDPISYPILGNEKNVKSFTKEQIEKHVRSFYIPENCVMSIAGSFDKNIYKLLHKYFGKWGFEDKNKKIIHFSKPQIFKKHLFKSKKIEQLHVSLGLKGIELGNDLIYPLLLINNIFGGGASSVLFQKIREERGRCYSIFSYISALNNTGIVSIYVALNPKYFIEVLDLIKEELYKFSKVDISKEKIIKGKEQLKGNYILGLESTSSVMYKNGRSVLFLNEVNKPEDIIKKIDKIDGEKIRKVMDDTFKKGILNSAYVGEDIDINLASNIIKEDRNLFKTKNNSTFI